MPDICLFVIVQMDGGVNVLFKHINTTHCVYNVNVFPHSHLKAHENMRRQNLYDMWTHIQSIDKTIK